MGWWKLPKRRRFWLAAMLIWAAFAHLLLGAVLSVMPLPIWPFLPEQTLSHNFAHFIYAVAQLPLIIFLLPMIRYRREKAEVS